MMFAKLKRKPILIGILCVAIVALVAVFAIPAIAAAPLPWAARPAVNNNVTVVQGTIASADSGSITIKTGSTATATVTLGLDKNTNFNIHGIDWLSGNLSGLVGKPVTAVYKNNQTAKPPVANQVSINMPAPPPGPVNPAIQNNFARVQGTLTAISGTSITVNPTAGGATVTLTLDKNASIGLHGPALALNGSTLTATVPAGATASVFYNSQTNVASQLMLNAPTAPPSPGTPNIPAKNTFARVQGTLAVTGNNTISVTPTVKDAINLTLDVNSNVELRAATLMPVGSGPGLTATVTVSAPVSVSAAYNTQGNTVIQLMIGAPAIAPSIGVPPQGPGGQFGGPNPPMRPQTVPGPHRFGGP